MNGTVMDNRTDSGNSNNASPLNPGTMKPPSYEQITQSRIFKFVIGPDKTEFNIHEAALSGLSRPLSALLQGHFSVACESRVEWPEVDVSTFVRFVEWACTRTYAVFTPKTSMDTTGESETSPAALATEEGLYSLSHLGSPFFVRLSSTTGNQVNLGRPADTGSGPRANVVFGASTTGSPANTGLSSAGLFGTPATGDPAGSGRPASTGSGSGSRGLFSTSNNPSIFNGAKTTQSARNSMVSCFLNDVGKLYPSLANPSLPQRNTAAPQDYTEVFLSHAKLYVLGGIYDIPALRQLSFHRLYATLKNFVLFPSRMNDIATLARYIFENTRIEDKIRDMVIIYYSCIIEDALKYPGVQSLIEDLPGFAYGLMIQMSKRLS